MSGRHRQVAGRPFRVVAAISSLAVAGGTCLGIALSAQESPPQPPQEVAQVSTGAHPDPAPAPTRTNDGTQRPRPAPAVNSALPRSLPSTLDIPAVGIHSDLMQLGRNADNSIQVPPLEEKDSRAGWYRYSPTPGELGPSILLGHVDSAKYGPAVFFRLGALRPGDAVSVHRADGSTARFRVDRVASYSKKDFPTEAVYGPIDHAGLRLITCGGTFDADAGSYESNIVVFASLITG